MPSAAGRAASDSSSRTWRCPNDVPVPGEVPREGVQPLPARRPGRQARASAQPGRAEPGRAAPAHQADQRLPRGDRPGQGGLSREGRRRAQGLSASGGRHSVITSKHQLADKELILGVTGSIAAYKAVYLLRELTQLGAGVTVVTTAHAREFIAPLTWRTLSGRPVLENLFDPQTQDAVEHVSLAERAHALLVVPATANILSKAAQGIADDFLTTLLLAARGPVLMAPAMDGGMWEHPAVVANVATLRQRGVGVLDPDTGPLASGATGQGRLPEVETIVEALLALLTPGRDLSGDRVL